LKRPDEALAQLERGRGQGLARQAAQNRTDFGGVLPKPEARRLKDATEAYYHIEIYCRNLEERKNAAEPEEARQIACELTEAKRARDEAQLALTAYRNELTGRFPVFRRFCGLELLTGAGFQALAKANPDTLYLVWALSSENSTLLFALRAGADLKAYTLPTCPS
jgi:hypothetical protein